MSTNPPRRIRMQASDNVAVVVNEGGLDAGAIFEDGLKLCERIPQGHKVALQDLPEGAAVRRYGVVIGHAARPIPAGSWVHERVLRMPQAPALESLPMANAGASLEAVPDLRDWTFEGYRNRDGTVGTRNLLAITQTVQCVAGIARIAAERIRLELLPRYPNVDGVVALEHSYGCGVAIEAPGADIPIRTLRHIALNPNFGGEVLMISLGCEKLQPERLMPAGLRVVPIAVDGPEVTKSPNAAHEPKSPNAAHEPLRVIRLQDEQHVGFMSMVEAVLQQADVHLQRLNARRREPVSISELVVGVQCGGSDAFSGITANPAVGACTDLLVRAGATVMFSENTEVRDAVDQLTSRAATAEVAQALIDELAWTDAYLERGGVDRGANTTPGNKAGGLSNIVEKAMGSIVKSGTGPIHAVLKPGNKLAPAQRGLVFCATPASDFICGTLQLAAGMNLHVFTTGRGTPYGLAEVPVIKVGTRTELAQRWHDLIDVNAGRIADGELTVEQAGLELLQLMVEVASGRHRTWAERWKLHNALVLFNPAPVT
ncbi:MAG: galactarate dehydratase [Burkholderiales bacterium]|nr:galactarate dehydratase [Burkholderiales bacterium]